jgi:hypothetical protein
MMSDTAVVTDTKMDPEIKAKWIAALESGEYKKGKHKLRGGDDTFCCLGVLCDIYHKETGKGEWLKQTPNALNAVSFNADVNANDCRNSLYQPFPVQMWSGIDYGQSRALANINDDAMTFDAVIAKIKEL